MIVIAQTQSGRWETFDLVPATRHRGFGDDAVWAIDYAFTPARDGRPQLDRIWHRIWNLRLERYDIHVDLVVHGSILDDATRQAVAL